jgi:cobalt-zinc-cadmium efflux system outer membrane protein
MGKRLGTPGGLVLALVVALGVRQAGAQGPTIPSGHAAAPGSTMSKLGPTPGAGGSPFGFLPGAGEMILGWRVGTSFPRVPASIATPGQGMVATPLTRVIAAPAPLPITTLPVFGPLELPKVVEEEGPPGGLTLDEAIERLVRDNLDLNAKSFEIPQAKADVLTASLRANPILYADTQLVPYGRYTRSTPGGPTQYDVNVSQPLDLSRKRQARTEAAERAVNVLEAQYQDAVRLQIDNLYTAYVDILAARETARFARASVAGLERVRAVTETLYKRSGATRPDLARIRMQKEAAEVGEVEAREALLRATRSLGVLLNVPPDRAEQIELRGTIADAAPPPPPVEELVRLALEKRPDLDAHRLGIRLAEADVRLAYAQRFSDVYLLYQPYTFQDLSPTGNKSATSWALGATVPLPVFNRNQGVIQRARMNVTQTQVELAMLEQRLSAEVSRAAHEYAVSRLAVRRLERELLPDARRMLDDAFVLFTGGEQDALYYFNIQRDYNDSVRQYRDALVRHRRSMLHLNTAVGCRILP